MPTLSPDIIRLLSIFTFAVTGPTLVKMMVLLQGTLLSSGRRTMGLSESQQFSKYHQVFNRATWSPWVVSRLLLELIINTCLPADGVLGLGIDDTLERRQGSQIKYKGWFRDPLPSTAKKVATGLGLRWLCVAVLTPVTLEPSAVGLALYPDPDLVAGHQPEVGQKASDLASLGRISGGQNPAVAARPAHCVGR